MLYQSVAMARFSSLGTIRDSFGRWAAVLDLEY